MKTKKPKSRKSQNKPVISPLSINLQEITSLTTKTRKALYYDVAESCWGNSTHELSRLQKCVHTLSRVLEIEMRLQDITLHVGADE